MNRWMDGWTDRRTLHNKLVQTDLVNITASSHCHIYYYYWRYDPMWVCILHPSSGAIASSRTRFLDHTQRRATVGRTPLDE